MRVEKQHSFADGHFKVAVDAAPNAMIMTNDQGQIVLANQQAELLFGYSKAELIGQSIEMLVPERYRQQHPHERRSFWEKPSPRKMGAGRDLFGLRKDKTEVPVEIGLTPVELKDGRYVISAIVDITERQKTEKKLQAKTEELARSNAELEQFAYVTSHDLQAPLRHITAYVQLLEKQLDGKLDAKSQQMMGFVVSGAKRMQQLINGLLSFSRVSRDRSHFSQADLNQIVQDALANLEIVLKESQVSVTVDPLPFVNVDAQLIVNLFQNLIENAAKFKKENEPGRIHIFSEIKGSEVIITVKDNGIGIQEEYKEKVFVIFQRLHTPEEYPGTGLGLAICKKILHFHGCQIWIESEYGVGSSFCFNLPLA